MANPQKEKGYTPIANEIMEALYRAEMSGQEFRLTLLILRKTYGFQKGEDMVSLSQMMAETGMTKTRCSQIINLLQLQKIVTVTENCNGICKKYKFNKDFDTWDTVTEKCNRIKKMKSTVTQKCNPPLQKSVTTKETLTKERLQKKIYTDEFLIFWEAYPNKQDKQDAFKAWRKMNGTRPSLDILLKAITLQQKWRDDADPEEFRPAWKNPATWLNKGSWEGEYKATARESPLDAWARKKQAEMEAAKNGAV